MDHMELMMNCRPFKISIFSLFLCLSFFAHAQRVQVSLNVTVAHVNDPGNVMSGIKPGDQITGNYTYETDTPDSSPQSTIGNYYHSTGTGGFDIQFGNYNVVTRQDSPQPLRISIYNSTTQNIPDSYDIRSNQLESSNGLNASSISIHLVSRQGVDGLTSDQLTSATPDLSLFGGYPSFELYGDINDSPVEVYGNVDYLSSYTTAPQSSHSYQVTAHITEINHFSSNTTQISVGDTIAAAYTIDSTTPGVDSYGQTEYHHLPGTGSLSFDLGSISLESDPNANTPIAFVINGVNTFDQDVFGLYSFDMRSSDPSVDAFDAWINFDGPASILSDNSLPTEINPKEWRHAEIFISTSSFNLWAEVTDLQPIPQEEIITVVPGDGSVFHSKQRFDAAFRVDDKKRISNYTFELNNKDLTGIANNLCEWNLQYPEQILLCRDMHQMLFYEPGPTKMRLRLEMGDSRIIKKDFTWILR